MYKYAVFENIEAYFIFAEKPRTSIANQIQSLKLYNVHIFHFHTAILIEINSLNNSQALDDKPMLLHGRTAERRR